ncbi:hypothetical protein KAV79_06925 [Candidatus Aerophobetes bacterium]|nr:hypothetical protein [Candidatus Aerophobetes bacterium]
MSEEKITVESFLEEASDMKNKIKELEQKLTASSASHTEDIDGVRRHVTKLESSPLAHWDFTHDIDVNKKKVESLEKKYELNKENIPKTIHKYYNKNKDEIDELRNQIQNDSIADLNHYTELKELSERNRLRVDELKDFRHNMAVPRIINLEEVLQEFKDKVLEYIFKSFITPQIWGGEVEEIFKKLDGENLVRDKGGMSDKHAVPLTQINLTDERGLIDSKPSLAGSARQTVFCPICGNEITKIEHVVFHDFKVIVAREDLKKWIWDLKHEMSRAHVIAKIEKYLKEEED